MRDSSSEEDFESRHRLDALFSGYVEEIGTYLRVTRARKILRRYFAMNAFDGVMTSLGVARGRIE